MLSTNNSKNNTNNDIVKTPTSKKIKMTEDILFAPKKKKNDKKNCLMTATNRIRRTLMFQH